jgi:hypothetical protein
VEAGVEVARGAEEELCKVSEAFEVRGHLEQELIGKSQERRLPADIFCYRERSHFVGSCLRRS